MGADCLVNLYLNQGGGAVFGDSATADVIRGFAVAAANHEGIANQLAVGQTAQLG
jgi:hypothetical protein